MRVTAFPIWGSAVVGLLSGILFVFSGAGVAGAEGGLLMFGIVLGAFAFWRNRSDESHRRIQQMFDEHPEVHEKFQSHWFFGRQVRRHDAEERKRRDR
jgi:hypothetical protein